MKIVWKKLNLTEWEGSCDGRVVCRIKRTWMGAAGTQQYLLFDAAGKKVGTGNTGFAFLKSAQNAAAELIGD